MEATAPNRVPAPPPGLSEVDRLVENPAFFETFEEFFDFGRGRPSIPMETYLRMTFLRFRYRLGFGRCAPKWPTRLPGEGTVATGSPTRFPTPRRS